MQTLQNKTQIKLLKDKYCNHPLYMACNHVFTPRIAHFDGVEIGVDDIFYAVAQLLDRIYNATNLTQKDVNDLWYELYIDIRKKKPDATEHDKRQVTHTVFSIVRKLLCHHWESRLCSTYFEYMIHTIESETKEANYDEIKDFQQRLTSFSSDFDNWINQEYDGRLSKEIEICIVGKADKTSFVPTRQTFSKTVQICDIQLRIIAQRLTISKKLDYSCSVEKWEKLFSGADCAFTIKWLGRPGELRDLFDMLTRTKDNGDAGYLTPHYGYCKIIQSHFTDKDGNYFNNIHKQKSINAFQTVIDDCEFFIQNFTEKLTDVMKEIIMEHENELREYGFIFNATTFKREGQHITNRRH